MPRFYNSGLYIEPFYSTQELDLEDENVVYNIEYNAELLKEYWKIEDSDDEYGEISERFWEALGYWYMQFEPLIFDEKIALECNLIPFTFNSQRGSKNLLALAGCGSDFSPKLDAYQALTQGMIDQGSKLFRDRDYFEYIVGRNTTEQVLQIIDRE